MYFVTAQFKGEEKAQVFGPFEARNLAEQGCVNLMARNDVTQALIGDESEMSEEGEEKGGS